MVWKGYRKRESLSLWRRTKISQKLSSEFEIKLIEFQRFIVRLRWRNKCCDGFAQGIAGWQTAGCVLAHAPCNSTVEAFPSCLAHVPCDAMLYSACTGDITHQRVVIMWYPAWCNRRDSVFCDECLYLVAGPRPADQWADWLVMTCDITQH
jgi:hypothetical protein